MGFLDDLKEKMGFAKSQEKPTDMPKGPDQKMDVVEAKVNNKLEVKKEGNETKDQLRMLERERNRNTKFQTLSASTTDNEASLLKNENVDTISASKLLELDKRGNRLSSIFAYKQTVDKDGNISETPLEHDSIAEGDNIFVDFGKNASANKRIGAGDILPSSVRLVKITDENGHERIGTRMISGSRVGYYDEAGKYLPIYNNYKIYIPKTQELASSEYSKFGLNSGLMNDKNELEKVSNAETEAKNRYLAMLATSEKAEKVNDIVVEISKEIGETKTYKEKLQKIVAKAQEYKNVNSKYSKDDIDLVVTRLSKTLEIIGDKDFGFDWDKYKAEISKIESGGSYFARNDEAGKSRGISSDKWAFGKYQFTTETLKGYGVDLGNPPEEDKIQQFLADSAKQEEIMDKYMVNCLEKYVMPNQDIMGKVSSKEKNLSYYLALTHIGGPGALKKSEGIDWLGTSTSYYASKVEKGCIV